MGQVITCDTLAELAVICAQLVREGVTFEAHTNRLKIYLTGGY
jgi:hypothetical protein